jgi:hypothetical protein
MQLVYDGADGWYRHVTAKITTEHALSSYGQPVVIIDGEPVDPLSWLASRLQEVDGTPQELELWRQWQYHRRTLLGCPGEEYSSEASFCYPP